MFFKGGGEYMNNDYQTIFISAPLVVMFLALFFKPKYVAIAYLLIIIAISITLGGGVLLGWFFIFLVPTIFPCMFALLLGASIRLWVQSLIETRNKKKKCITDMEQQELINKNKT